MGRLTRLLIGADVTRRSGDATSFSSAVSISSTVELTQKLNSKLILLQEERTVQHIQPAGAHNGYYACDGLDLLAQGSQYLNVGIVKKYKGIPAQI
ncbi:hypothetical protein N7462_009655 [Penicillium macrosclerotiorum]|uniref:uncharacterized protein n=1 Tax=Penicillium macrosclerotiorum TaxID=303699 RepID=UPI00254747AE|nr:uncharacterized protein N7462_009655 [Penicillium macrosclerotiorum]KAJ5674216.1 hypothetical protein N7462_009655 [Penicillium macrosclerotiorum]